MSRIWKVGSALVACSVIAWAAFAGWGCEELSKVSFTVEQETEAFVLDLDAELAKAQTAGTVDGWDDIPEGVCLLLKGQALRDMFLADTTDVDLANSPQGDQVTKYKDKIEAVDIDELFYVVVENSLAFDIPRIDFFVGDHGAEANEFIVQTGKLKKGETGTYPLEVTEEIVTSLGTRLEEDMKFSYTFQMVDADGEEEGIELCPGDSLGVLKVKAKLKATVYAQAAE